jgi:acetyl esterase/lipase
VDVYVPANIKKDEQLPVKFWAYGGSNQGGATSYGLYDGCHLPTDVIAVEFNYRLGPLGFLGLTDAGIPGNMAIQDTLAALQWVQDNIAAFGGDRSRVMMFGQSAGADNTFTITTLPQSKGLISAAVTESGGGQFMLPPEIADQVGAEFAKSLNCSTSDASLISNSTRRISMYILYSLTVVHDSLPASKARLWMILPRLTPVLPPFSTVTCPANWCLLCTRSMCPSRGTWPVLSKMASLSARNLFKLVLKCQSLPVPVSFPCPGVYLFLSCVSNPC